MTGWADTWMMSSSAPHPNCMLEWMEYSLGADVQAETAEYYGAAASNTAACPILRESLDEQFDFGDAVDTVRYGYCGDEAFLDPLWLWRTPQSPDRLLRVGAEVDGDPRRVATRGVGGACVGRAPPTPRRIA